MFSGMDREQWHVRSFRRSFPTGNRLLVVIDNFNIRRTGGTFWPFEANTPLVVDADAVLAFPAALQGLEPVSRQNCKVAEREGRFEPVQLQTGGALDAREGFDTFSGREGSSFLVPETNDHECSIANNTQYVKRNVDPRAPAAAGTEGSEGSGKRDVTSLAPVVLKLQAPRSARAQ